MNSMCPLVCVDDPESRSVADGYTTSSILLVGQAVGHSVYSSLTKRPPHNMLNHLIAVITGLNNCTEHKVLGTEKCPDTCQQYKINFALTFPNNTDA